MDENEKRDYLQTIEEKLRNQTDFKTNEVPKVSLENDLNSNDVNPMEVDSNIDLIDKLIDSIKENVLSLKENRLLLKPNHKKGLTLIMSQFNDFMNEMKDKS